MDIFFYLCTFVGSISHRSPLSSYVAILRSVCLPYIIIFYSSSQRVLRHIVVGRLLTQCSHYSPDTFSPSAYYTHRRYRVYALYVLPIHLYVYTCILYTNTTYIHKQYAHTSTYTRLPEQACLHLFACFPFGFYYFFSLSIFVSCIGTHAWARICIPEVSSNELL